jgi:hypothetical protein
VAGCPEQAVPSRDGSCDGVGARGWDAFEQRDWRSVLELTASKNCWRSSEQDRVQLRTTALYHLGRWEECANLGALSQHPDVLSLTQVCTSTANRKHPEAK